jgi:osmotically-inducible protein OsmY
MGNRNVYDDRYRERYETTERMGYRREEAGGGHRGKGPSGYTRSDERIREDVNDALTEDDFVDASNVEVEVKQGEVTLTGTVPERRMKRLAEDCIERVAGIKDVNNHIRTRTNSGAMRSQSVSSSPEKDTDNGKRRGPSA